MATWPADGDTNWNTKMLAYLAVEHETDGTHSMIDGDNPTSDDSDPTGMLKAHAYLTQTAGFVNAFTTSEVGKNLKGYVGTTNNPAGAGTKVAHHQVTTENEVLNISFFVASGKYFEITTTGVVTIIWTPLIKNGGAPIDQD